MIVELKDTDLIQMRSKFGVSVDQAILKERCIAWNYQLLLVILALIVIFPSEFFGIFELIADQDE